VDAPNEELLEIRGGDRIELRCKYNSTVQNPFVLRALADQNPDAPVTVHLGESTTDEMCLSLLAMITS
jgi:hypothetical protein